MDPTPLRLCNVDAMYFCAQTVADRYCLDLVPSPPVDKVVSNILLLSRNQNVVR